MRELKWDSIKLASIFIVREFQDVFLKELSRLTPSRDIEILIKLSLEPSL
jgi:hypothetical protein